MNRSGTKRPDSSSFHQDKQGSLSGENEKTPAGLVIASPAGIKSELRNATGKCPQFTARSGSAIGPILAPESTSSASQLDISCSAHSLRTPSRRPS